jgi:hypothetical protein
MSEKCGFCGGIAKEPKRIGNTSLERVECTQCKNSLIRHLTIGPLFQEVELDAPPGRRTTASTRLATLAS